MHRMRERVWLMSEKSGQALESIVRDSYLNWDLREEAMDELIEQGEHNMLYKLAEDQYLHWQLRERAMQGLRKPGK